MKKVRAERVIGSDFLVKGRMLVTIDDIEPDRFSSSAECGEWFEWVPVQKAVTVADNGDYWVGDLALGTWQVPEGCIWEKVVAFRGARSSDIQESQRGPKPLIIDSDTTGVRIRGCTLPVRFVSS